MTLTADPYWSGYSLQRGDSIQAGYNGQQTSMIIQNLNAVVDADTNLITGTAYTPGTGGTPISEGRIDIGVSQEWGTSSLYNGNTSTLATGAFSLNTFTDKGFDLLAGQKIWLMLTDSQGNLTSIAAYNGIPKLMASAGYNWIRGNDFPPNAILPLTINSDLGLSASITTDGNGFFVKNVVEFNGYQLKPGDVITVSYGADAAMTLTIPNNISTVANSAGNVISGTAPAYQGKSLLIFIFEPNGGPLLYSTTITADSNGKFSSNLPLQDGGTFDLVPGQIVLIAETESNGNQIFFKVYNAVLSEVPIQWTVESGGNGHWYEVVTSKGTTNIPYTWAEANAAATSVGGYLVSITSAAENKFVSDLIADTQYWYWLNLPENPSNDFLVGPWTGGYQPEGANEPDGGWRWSNEADFSYNNWHDDQPNNDPTATNPQQDRIQFLISPADRPHQGAMDATDFTTVPEAGYGWNDMSSLSTFPSYIVEYDSYPPAGSGNIPDTAQTASYTDTFGEDSDYTTNPPSYTKLGQNGAVLPNTATKTTGWIMTRDNVTGLTWEVKTDDGSFQDKDNTYTWCDSHSETNGGNEGTCGNGTDTAAFIAALNAANFGGYSDWRLPTAKELSTLVNRGRQNPSIQTGFFPNTMPGNYWSSTVGADHSESAWAVGFYVGGVYGRDKSSSLYARAVRGGVSETFGDSVASERLVDNGDGTVTDTQTGIMWQKEEAGKMTWTDALSYCENSVLAGYTDWRLPNTNELQSIVDYSQNDPATDAVAFPGATSSSYWSSTSLDSFPGAAWSVHFDYGMVGYFGKLNSLDVRPVRNAQ